MCALIVPSTMEVALGKGRRGIQIACLEVGRTLPLARRHSLQWQVISPASTTVFPQVSQGCASD